MPDHPPLRDYSRSRAVVMGTWDYVRLPPVPAVGNSLERMVRLLTGPLCGWPGQQVLVLANERGPGDLPDRLITAFEDVTDVALFYYVGHGQIDMDGQLCLGLAESRTEPNRRAATSLQFQAVRRALLDSGAATKIVILDCCFAGLASQPTNTLAALPGDVLDKTAGTGAYTMAASGAYATAWYETGPDAIRPQTFFTQCLADLVESGIPGQAPGLRLHPLFTHLCDSLARDQRPVPCERSVDAARDFVFAHNAAPPHTHRDPDLELQQANQRIAETEARRAREQADAEAREQALRAEVAERTRELERLREQARHSASMPAGQQRQLHDAIQEAGRRLDETAAAERPGTAPGTAAEPPATPAAVSDLGSQARPPPADGTAPTDPAASEETHDPRLRSGKMPAARSVAAIMRAHLPLSALLGGLCICILIAGAFLLLSAISPRAAHSRAISSGKTLPSAAPDATLSGPDGYDIHGVAFSMGGQTLAAGLAPAADDEDGGGAYAWDVTNRVLLASLADPAVGRAAELKLVGNSAIFAEFDATISNPACHAACQAAAQVTAQAEEESSVESYDSHVVGSSSLGGGSPVFAVAFSPDRDTLAVSEYGGPELWDVTTRKIIATLLGPGSDSSITPTSLAFSPDGQTLAAAAGTTCYLWNVSAQKITATFRNPGKDPINSIAFSPDGQTLAAASGDSTYLWNVSARRLTVALPDLGSDGVTSVAFSPDGKTLATGDADGSTYLWNPATHKLTATLRNPGGSSVNAVAFSLDGKTLAACGGGTTSYLWNLAAHKPIAALRHPGSNGITTVAFSPGGKTLAAAGGGSVYLWNTSALES